MSTELIIHLNRTNIVPLNLGMDVSGDTITSQIRKEIDHLSDLIATWTVTNATDGTDGKIVLTLPKAALASVTEKFGYMDLKRVSDTNELSVFREPLRVRFEGVVTA